MKEGRRIYLLDEAGPYIDAKWDKPWQHDAFPGGVEPDQQAGFFHSEASLEAFARRVFLAGRDSPFSSKSPDGSAEWRDFWAKETEGK